MPKTMIDIPIFYGTYADLTKLDLSFINARIVLHKGKYFRESLKKILHPDIFQYSYSSVIDDFKDHYVFEGEGIRRYAIVPLDHNKPFLEGHWIHFHQMMLSLYPSDFVLLEIIHLESYNGMYQSSGKTTYPFHSSGEKTFDNFMFIDSREYKFVRAYLKNYFFISMNLKYIKYMLGVYSNSFRENNSIYQYLSLIICLEVTVDGNEQLTYKLRRNTALLCGEKVKTCKRIFENVNQLYKLRSAIVHGNINPSYKNFKEYHDYLKSLVGRLIRELIVHNIPTVSELNEKITELGFGQNKLLSINYIASKYPFLENIRLSYKAIQKY
jgi:hypothetical protein